MTELKELKKELVKMKRFKSALPRLIDCSEVYGDGYYSQQDLSDIEEEIKEVEAKIESLSK